jgi:hypothetical protein
MRARHAGKMRNWFNDSTRWKVVELDALEGLAKVVFLECDWTKLEKLVIPDKLNYRLLGQVVENALTGQYLARLPQEHKHRIYYDSLVRGGVQLAGMDRIAICSAEQTEIELNPAARYYLLDGAGRCLPYMILLNERKLKPATVEAFLAER